MSTSRSKNPGDQLVEPSILLDNCLGCNEHAVDSRGSKSPDIWLGNVGQLGADHDSKPFESALANFVGAALEELEARRDGERTCPWPKRRLAVNVLGSGTGGAAFRKGGLVSGLLKALDELARDRDIDLVLVTFGEKPYAAAQYA